MGVCDAGAAARGAVGCWHELALPAQPPNSSPGRAAGVALAARTWSGDEVAAARRTGWCNRDRKDRIHVGRADCEHGPLLLRPCLGPECQKPSVHPVSFSVPRNAASLECPLLDACSLGRWGCGLAAPPQRAFHPWGCREPH